VPIHLLGANKRTLTALGESLRYVYSFDSDAYRLVPNNKLRKEDLGDRRFMVTTAVDARKWANEWLGEIAKYITQ
jgi:replication-associated recombination protein RarA